MKPKIVKFVPSGGNRNGNGQKNRKIDFFENIAVFKWILDKKKILKYDAP